MLKLNLLLTDQLLTQVAHHSEAGILGEGDLGPGQVQAGVAAAAGLLLEAAVLCADRQRGPQHQPQLRGGAHRGLARTPGQEPRRHLGVLGHLKHGAEVFTGQLSLVLQKAPSEGS